MKQLQDYVDSKNKWNAIFGGKPLDLGNAKDRQRIADSIDSDLSPENISCDGELPASTVRARYVNLTKCADQLKKLDPNVQFYEY